MTETQIKYVANIVPISLYEADKLIYIAILKYTFVFLPLRELSSLKS